MVLMKSKCWQISSRKGTLLELRKVATVSSMKNLLLARSFDKKAKETSVK